MFREIRRKKQSLNKELCIKILKEEKRGVLALCGDNYYPYAVPMNFFFDEKENSIYFHGSKEGHKIDAIKNSPKASFCVFDKGIKRENHWSYDVSSVIVFGKISIIEDKDISYNKIKDLALKYYPDTDSVEKEMKYAKNAACLKLEILHMTGKTINES